MEASHRQRLQDVAAHRMRVRSERHNVPRRAGIVDPEVPEISTHGAIQIRRRPSSWAPHARTARHTDGPAGQSRSLSARLGLPGPQAVRKTVV